MSLVRSIRPRIVYAGLPLGALALVRSGLPPVATLIGHPDAPGMHRLRRVAARHGIMLLGKPPLGSPAIRAALGSLRPEALLSWFWPRRLPEALLEALPLGAYGVHPSLLPRHRGPDPYFWALYRGDRYTGVTLHALDAGYDTGALIMQTRLAIRSGDDAWSLARHLDRPGLALLIQAARQLQRGEPLHGVAQDASATSDAPQPGARMLAIDWRRPTAELERLVRAAAPWPGASAYLGASALRIVRTAPQPLSPLLRTLRPAEATLDERGCVVRTGDGGLRLLRARHETGDRPLGAMDIAALLNAERRETNGPGQRG